MQTSTRPKIGVFTANSKSGLSCVEALLPRANEFEIVAIVRSEDKVRLLIDQLGEDNVKKITVRVGADATDRESMLTALADIERLLVVTPHTTNRGTLGRQMVQAAKDAGVSWLVFVSSWTSYHQHPLFDDEFKFTEDLGIELFPHRVTILRCGYFMTNFFGQAKAVKEHSKIFLPFEPTARFCTVDPSDIGYTAAVSLATSSTLLDEPAKIIDITGPEFFTAEQIAQAFSQVRRKDVTYEHISIEQMKETLQSIGMAQWTIDFVEAAVTFMNQNAIENPSMEYQEITGRRSTFKQFLENNQHVFTN